MDGYKIFDYYDFTDKVDITDPCYNKDVWCRINDVDLLPGEYCGYVKLTDGDTRVAELFVLNSDYMIENITPGYEEVQQTEELGEIGVDAGMAGVFQNKPNFTDAEWQEFCDWVLQFDNPVHTWWDYGLLVSSGYGDGGYPVFGWRDRDDNLVGIQIVFINTER